MILNDFQNNFMSQLGFKAQETGFKTTFSDIDNPNKGFITYYERKDAYTLVYATYKIKKDFKLNFNEEIHHLRFGLVEEGVAEYQIEDKPVTNFKPAPFIAIEHNLSGTQRWRKHQHYTGIELFIEITHLYKLSESFPSLNRLLTLPVNNALLYLPLEVIDTLRSLVETIKINELTPLLLGAKILECLALLEQALSEFDDQGLSDLFMLNAAKKLMDKCQINKNDVETIREIKNLLRENLQDPPTIQEICKRFYINEQKLTCGFKSIYKTTIGNYIKDLRISQAANLLSTTDLSIEEISCRVGYSHPSNLSKVFKKKYHRTPLQYRKTK